MKSDVYIYAETAFHHQGELDYMLKLIDMADESHVNGIKFQVLLDFDYLISKKHSAYKQLKEYTFNEKDWKQILEYALTKKLDIILMPLDPESCGFLSSYDIRYAEIHSVCFYDKEILDLLKKSNTDIIIGVGGRNLSEIDNIKQFFGEQLKVLMTGFQSFPSVIKDVKLSRISHYVGKYPDLIIGYGDHSGYNDENALISNDYALLLGARMFEKHITINEGDKRVDFESAIGGDKLEDLVARLKRLKEDILDFDNDCLFDIVEPELTYRNRQKVAVASVEIKEGTVLNESHFIFRMAQKIDGITSSEFLIGKKVLRKLDAYEPFEKSYLSE